MRANYVIRQGEPIVLSLLVLEGDASIISSVEAVLKVAGPNGTAPGLSSPVILDFKVTEAAQPDVGWDLSIDAELSKTLKSGYYITDAKLNLVEGGPAKTEPVLIEIRGSVT